MTEIMIHSEDEEAVAKVASLVECLGYQVVVAESMTSAREVKLAELGAVLKTEDERRVLRVMTMTNNAKATALLLNMNVRRAKYLEHCVYTLLGVNTRAALLRKVAGIEGQG